MPRNETNGRIESEVIGGALAEELTEVLNSDEDTTLVSQTNKIDKKPNVIPDLHLEPSLEVSGDAIQSSEVAETEVFYTFTWGKRSREQKVVPGHKKYKSSDKDQRKRAKGKGNKSHSKNNKIEADKASFTKKEKQIDPDNPFAAALKGFNQN
jgi:ATP-dependent RNA helicase SUPV3L1/SUV3